MLAIRLPESIEQRLQDLADKTGRTKTFYARKAILELIEDMEDYYLAIERLEKPEPVYSQKEVRRELGLDN